MINLVGRGQSIKFFELCKWKQTNMPAMLARDVLDWKKQKFHPRRCSEVIMVDGISVAAPHCHWGPRFFLFYCSTILGVLAFGLHTLTSWKQKNFSSSICEVHNQYRKKGNDLYCYTCPYYQKSTFYLAGHWHIACFISLLEHRSYGHVYSHKGW